MREFSTPMTVQVPRTGNLTDDVVRNEAEAPYAVVLSRRGDDGWSEVTASQFAAEVRTAAKGLVAAGIEPGDRVGLMSSTRFEWTLLDYAIWFAGAVSVPIYETSSTDQVGWILADSGARAVLVENQAHRARVAEVRGDLPGLEHVWVVDDGAVDLLGGQGGEVADDELERRRTHATPLDLATLIYTSGTTGRPKGCMLTHGNFMTELAVATEELHDLFDPDDAATLLFLPLAHVFARIIQVGCIRTRTRLGHSADVRRLTEDLAVFRPTFLLAVPRIFEKVFNTASQQAMADGRGAIFARAVDAAITWSRELEQGGPSLRARARHAFHDRLVYRRLRQVFGGDCRYAISGGAPLGERLAHFYRGIGLPVLEGYGLTETTAALTVNLPDAQRVGTVGRPLPGTAVRIADDGELLFSGGQVFAGYWENEPATRECLERDGWFHTGDVGEVDDEGFVRITGRKKELLVTAGGKNVAPAVLEDLVRAHPLVSHCLVVGDGQPFVAALITLDHEYLTTWAAEHGHSGRAARPEVLARDPQLLAEVATAVEEANRAVSQAESIRKFEVLGTDWTEEDGQLTPSLKLKRNVVAREHKDDIAALYLA